MSSWSKNPNRAKFYKGSSADSAWNHDLLWKARVTSENGLIGIKHHENVPSHYTTTVGPAGNIDAQRRLTAKDQEKIAELRHMLRVEQEKTRAMEEKLNRILEIVLLKKHNNIANRSLGKRLGRK
eukprot:INCI15352.1.p1 GENE.INCI15352.1~~INCI15352.1.p1  ORF type:complete len:125 (+),score=21.59 INCI15352.1:189-563(+)